MSNSEKVYQYLKDNEINPIAVLVLIRILLNDIEN